MVVKPVAIPVMIPVPDPIDASDGLALLQLPPGEASVTVAVVPGHIVVAPAIASGAGFTVVVLTTGTKPVQPLISV